MKVFKFGGASVSSAERIANVANILRNFPNEKLLIIISAMGKTTNALEAVVQSFFDGNKEAAIARFEAIKEDHITLTETLGVATERLSDLFTEAAWMLHEKPVRAYDYYYDQIVCLGELFSTSIISDYLNNIGIKNSWLDVRDVMRTDASFRNANINWEVTAQNTHSYLLPLFDASDIVITQGFIGATAENESTTLGREGSDYTAAVFANLLDAESQTIWKDVQGVMNADPKSYANARWIDELSYREVIEMAFYGAQVIHPKTIKPLQNKGVPLYVKSFLNPHAPGTVIREKATRNLPPIVVYKKAQALVELRSKDFSFAGDHLTASVYALFNKLNWVPNLTQNGAISLLCVVDETGDKLDRFAEEAATYADLHITPRLTLLTIRHYNDAILNELTDNRNILLRQQTRETIQLLME